MDQTLWEAAAEPRIYMALLGTRQPVCPARRAVIIDPRLALRTE